MKSPANLLALVLLALGSSALPVGAQMTPTSPDSLAPYAVRPGDRIGVRIWSDNVSADTVQVDSRGEIVLPRLGSVEVGGLLPDSVIGLLRRSYRDYLRDPAIEVTVLRRIGVQGEVRLPGLYWVDPTVTLGEVIAMAGGMSVIADADEIEVLRGDEALDVESGPGSYIPPVPLVSGDQVVVGRKSWFVLNASSLLSVGVSLLSIITAIVLSN